MVELSNLEFHRILHHADAKSDRICQSSLYSVILVEYFDKSIYSVSIFMRPFRSLLNSLISNLSADISRLQSSAMATPKTSLSTSRPPSTPPATLSSYANKGLSHPSHLDPLTGAQKQLCKVKPLAIKVNDDLYGTVPAFLHVPHNYNYRREQAEGREKMAAILLSGAGGGVVGPSSMYLSMADKLASLNTGIPVMRLDYRYPARNKYCVADVLAAMNYLETGYGLSRFVLVGWSFGGAPVFTLGGSDERVVGCATVASQTADTDGIRSVAPRPVLLMHGTGDKTLRYSCSRRLYDEYGTKGERELKLFEGDDHALTTNAGEAGTRLCGFVMKCAGVEMGGAEQDLLREELIGGEDRVALMKEGGDLKGGENVE